MTWDNKQKKWHNTKGKEKSAFEEAYKEAVLFPQRCGSVQRISKWGGVGKTQTRVQGMQ